MSVWCWVLQTVGGGAMPACARMQGPLFSAWPAQQRRNRPPTTTTATTASVSTTHSGRTWLSHGCSRSSSAKSVDCVTCATRIGSSTPATRFIASRSSRLPVYSRTCLVCFQWWWRMGEGGGSAENLERALLGERAAPCLHCSDSAARAQHARCALRLRAQPIRTAVVRSRCRCTASRARFDRTVMHLYAHVCSYTLCGGSHKCRHHQQAA